TPAHDVTATVAPFRAWPGSRLIIAGGPMGPAITRLAWRRVGAIVPACRQLTTRRLKKNRSGTGTCRKPLDRLRSCRYQCHSPKETAHATRSDPHRLCFACRLCGSGRRDRLLGRSLLRQQASRPLAAHQLASFSLSAVRFRLAAFLPLWSTPSWP